MMRNNTLEELFARKSVRAFEDKPIPAEARALILRAAMEAPTACNQQRYSILEITDPEMKARFAESCDHQPFIARAPMVLVFCADCRRWLEAYREAGCAPRRPGAGDLMLAVTDAAIAAQNAVTAAWSLGIGSCYIGDIIEHRELHGERLGLPEYVVPAVMCVFGYPTKQQMERQKPGRFEVDDIVFENTYREQDGAQLRRMFAPRAGELGFDEWVKRTHDSKYGSEFALEMTRSMEAYLEDFGMRREL